MILGLNTATTITYITLVNEGKIVDEKSWSAEQNEAETLLPELQKMFDKNNLKWDQINEVAVVTGPGPFTALRVSVAIANAIAYSIKAPVIDIPAEDFWRARVGEEFAVYAGGNKIYYHGNLLEADDFLSQIKSGMTIAGQLKSSHLEEIKSRGGEYTEEEKLKTLGEFLVENSDKFERKNIVKPRYFSKPHITVSKKNYK